MFRHVCKIRFVTSSVLQAEQRGTTSFTYFLINVTYKVVGRFHVAFPFNNFFFINKEDFPHMEEGRRASQG